MALRKQPPEMLPVLRMSYAMWPVSTDEIFPTLKPHHFGFKSQGRRRGCRGRRDCQGKACRRKTAAAAGYLHFPQRTPTLLMVTSWQQPHPDPAAEPCWHLSSRPTRAFTWTATCAYTTIIANTYMRRLRFMQSETLLAKAAQD